MTIRLRDWPARPSCQLLDARHWCAQVHAAVTYERGSLGDRVESPLQAWANDPLFGRTAPGSCDRAGAVRGSGEVDQVRPLGVVELDGAGDGVEDTGRHPGEGAAFELGVDAHAGQRSDFAAAQAGDAA